MAAMILGLWLWAFVHFVPSMAPGIKADWKAKLGVGGYVASFSLLIVLSIVLIVLGWRSMEPITLYTLPPFVRHISMAMILLAFVLIVTGRYPSRIAQRVRHPMLIGFKIWAVAHLLVNGDTRSVLLFGSLLIWSIVNVISINRRDGKSPPDAQPLSLPLDIGLMIMSVIVYACVAVYAHPWLSGVALM